MYKVHGKAFNNASDALDFYIKNFQINSNYQNIETRCSKSVTKEYRLDKLEALMNTNLKMPIFNFVSCDEPESLSDKSKAISIAIDSHCPDLTAISQVEKLINNLSCKVDNYSRIEGIGSFNSTGKSSNSNLDFSSSSKSTEDGKQHLQLTDINDPIMKSIIKFEDLNKQLLSKNLFTKIESSLHLPTVEDSKIVQTQLDITEKIKKSDFITEIPSINLNSANFINECLKILN